VVDLRICVGSCIVGALGPLERPRDSSDNVLLLESSDCCSMDEASISAWIEARRLSFLLLPSRPLMHERHD